MVGIAREVAALTGAELTLPRTDLEPSQATVIKARAILMAAFTASR